MTRKLLVDDLVDPLDWLCKTAIDAKLNVIRLEDVGLSMGLSYQGKKMTITLSEKHLKSLTLPQVEKIFTGYRGNYLLRALAHRIENG
jgi:hypothetical protein